MKENPFFTFQKSKLRTIIECNCKQKVVKKVLERTLKKVTETRIPTNSTKKLYNKGSIKK